MRQTELLARGAGNGAIEPTVAGDDDPFGRVAQRGVGRRRVRAPRARAVHAVALHPDDLPAEQQAEVVLEDARDVAGEAAIRLAAEVGDVDGDAATGLEHAHALGEDVAQHDEVVDVRLRHVTLAEDELVLLRREVWR